MWINFLVSRFFELFLYNDGMFMVLIFVWLGYIFLVFLFVVGVIVDWLGVYELGICFNFFNIFLYFGFKELIFF